MLTITVFESKVNRFTKNLVSPAFFQRYLQILSIEFSNIYTFIRCHGQYFDKIYKKLTSPFARLRNAFLRCAAVYGIMIVKENGSG